MSTTDPPREPSAIDYTAAALTYDNTRGYSDALIDRFRRTAALGSDAHVLEFGCGTANYLLRIHQRYGCRCYGVEPSEGMRAVACAKSAALRVVEGDHRSIPLPAESFDFAYMIDVIHHVPDLASMFRQLYRVLKADGVLAVVTESHAQIDGRFYNRYFPSLARLEKRRYPDIGEIAERAAGAGFRCLEVEVFARLEPLVVSEAFIRNVEEKNFSMFRLLAEPEFAAGLKALAGDHGRSFEKPTGGGTLLWFGKSTRSKG